MLTDVNPPILFECLEWLQLQPFHGVHYNIFLFDPDRTLCFVCFLARELKNFLLPVLLRCYWRLFFCFFVCYCCYINLYNLWYCVRLPAAALLPLLCSWPCQDHHNSHFWSWNLHTAGNACCCQMINMTKLFVLFNVWIYTRNVASPLIMVSTLRKLHLCDSV